MSELIKLGQETNRTFQFQVVDHTSSRSCSTLEAKLNCIHNQKLERPCGKCLTSFRAGCPWYHPALNKSLFRSHQYPGKNKDRTVFINSLAAFLLARGASAQFQVGGHTRTRNCLFFLHIIFSKIIQKASYSSRFSVLRPRMLRHWYTSSAYM